jgi:tetratricopeptide (TPR) repeat protein
MPISTSVITTVLRRATVTKFAPLSAAVLLAGCATSFLSPNSVVDSGKTTFAAVNSNANSNQNSGAKSASDAQIKGVQLYQLGRSEFERGAYELAIASFKQALMVDPDSTYARNGIATVLFQLGRHDEALEAIQVAVRMSPNDLVLNRNLAKITSFLKAYAGSAVMHADGNLATSIQTAPIDRIPSVINLGETPVSQLATNRTDYRQIEVTPMSLPSGYVRVLPTAQLTLLAPNVYELSQESRSVSRSTELPVKPEATVFAVGILPIKPVAARSKKLTTSVRLSVANGSGKKGLACGQANILGGVGAGEVVIRASCTDYKNFNQQQTTLYLRQGVQLDAKALAVSLGSDRSFRVIRVSAGANENLPSGKDAQLVIGKDWSLTNPPINHKRLPSTPARIIAS